jgi:AcrR family transcriptional regulator
MARPKSKDKRDAIIAAATRIIVTHGLAAPTAMIAKQAGVPNGSLFTYFPTKPELFNSLYLELKTDMAAAILSRPTAIGVREQMFTMFSNWVRWAVSNPHKRRALTQLGVCEEITPATRDAGHETMAGIRGLLEKSRKNGPMRKAPMWFVIAVMTALAEATIELVIQDPANTDKHCKTGFDALWRAIA